jgi:hypothetical protein
MTAGNLTTFSSPILPDHIVHALPFLSVCVCYSCWGTIVRGFDDAIQRIKSMPGTEFIDDPSKHVLIKELIIMVHNPMITGKSFMVWEDPDPTSQYPIHDAWAAKQIRKAKK